MCFDLATIQELNKRRQCCQHTNRNSKANLKNVCSFRYWLKLSCIERDIIVWLCFQLLRFVKFQFNSVVSLHTPIKAYLIFWRWWVYTINCVCLANLAAVCTCMPFSWCRMCANFRLQARTFKMKFRPTSAVISGINQLSAWTCSMAHPKITSFLYSLNASCCRKGCNFWIPKWHSNYS